MKSVIPTYILVVGYTILMMMGITLISVQAQISAARDVHTSCLNQIQSTSFDTQTIANIQEEVKSKYGWTLDVSEQTVYKDRKAERITLNYTIDVPFTDIGVKSASISAYGK